MTKATAMMMPLPGFMALCDAMLNLPQNHHGKVIEDCIPYSY
jgi:hypothetical protein